jgi:hypothetical protein
VPPGVDNRIDYTWRPGAVLPERVAAFENLFEQAEPIEY